MKRPGFQRLVERSGELPLFRAAHSSASVSHEVDRQLAELGIHSSRRLVLANGVDTAEFTPGDPEPELLDEYGMRGRLVIGWIGGFRPFHGLNMVRQVAAGLEQQVPGAVLCLIGSGPLRGELEDAQRDLPNRRVLPAVPDDEIRDDQASTSVSCWQAPNLSTIRR